MLGFFRRYERYFFVVITIVIVISFTFFGTYSTMQSDPSSRDETVFYAVDGSAVSRSDLDRMVMFLGTDTEDKMIFGGVWGPNFLNDGVIKRDFLKSGLGEILADAYMEELRPDLIKRFQKEKGFKPYTHPQAPFISADGAWQHMAPEIKANFDALQRAEDPSTSDAFSTRVHLYLAEKALPPPMLMQVLRYQEKQYSWVKPDQNLNRTDLELFGYRTVEDWFGLPFTQLVAEFVINSAKIAEQKGYHVSDDEALTDLMRNAEASFQQNQRNPHMGVSNSYEYFKEQLRRMGLGQRQAVKIWQQVMLFRRLFIDGGRSAFVDPLTFEHLNTYARETVEGDLYQLPEELRLGGYRDMQKLEIYLDAVAQRPERGVKRLQMPMVFLSPEAVTKKHPELVQKRYLLNIASIDNSQLQAKVGIRDTWNWQVEEANWQAMMKEFPELGTKKSESREDRIAAMDSLDSKTRSRADRYARKKIVESHPEWVEEILEQAEPEQQVVGLRRRGGTSPFEGLERRQELIDILDQAPIGKVDPKLTAFTADDRHYYRIIVLEKAPALEILTFAEADQAGVLDETLDRLLEMHYVQERKTHPDKFQQADGSWKRFSDVKNQVADLYFAATLDAIRAVDPDKAKTGDTMASQRFVPHLQQVRDDLQNDGNMWVQSTKKSPEKGVLADRSTLTDQWKVLKREYHTDRGQEEPYLDKDQIFALEAEAWGEIQTAPNGDLSVFHLKRKGNGASIQDLTQQVNRAYQLVSNDAQKTLMQSMINSIKSKNAISFEHLKRPSA